MKNLLLQSMNKAKKERDELVELDPSLLDQISGGQTAVREGDVATLTYCDPDSGLCDNDPGFPGPNFR